jgi:hypothetical protein
MLDGEGVIPGVVVDAGDGGGSAPSEPSEPIESSDPVEPVEPLEPTEPTEPTEPPVDDTLGEDGKPDARKVEAKVRNALAELSKTDPNSAKTLREKYFKSNQYETEFKTPAEARTARVMLENLGGPEGIEQLQTEVGDYRREIEQFSAGDPALLNELRTANPESFAKMTNNAVEMMRSSMAPKDFREAMAPTIAGMLDDWGFTDAVLQVSNYVKEGKGQEAYNLLRDMAAHLSQVKNSAAERAKAPKVDPQAEANKKDREKIDADRAEMHNSEINSQLTTLNNAVIKGLVDPVIKAQGLGEEGTRDFINGLNQKIWADMKADADWQKLAQAVKRKGDARKTAAFVAAKFAERAPEIFTKHRNALYPSKGTKKPAQTNVKPPPVQAVPGKVYERSQVDIMGTPDEIIINGKAYLKGSKQIVAYRR